MTTLSQRNQGRLSAALQNVRSLAGAVASPGCIFSVLSRRTASSH